MEGETLGRYRVLLRGRLFPGNTAREIVEPSPDRCLQHKRFGVYSTNAVQGLEGFQILGSPILILSGSVFLPAFCAAGTDSVVFGWLVIVIFSVFSLRQFAPLQVHANSAAVFAQDLFE